jgi:dynein heavy chain 2, cytosolic
VDHKSVQICQLQLAFRNSVDCVESTQVGLKSAESTLAAAASLLRKLTGEKSSWTAQAREHEHALATLPACAAVAAAFITYASCESEAIRLDLLSSWSEIDGLELPLGFSLQGFLSSESELLQWKEEGLQGDQVSCSPSQAACKVSFDSV